MSVIDPFPPVVSGGLLLSYTNKIQLIKFVPRFSDITLSSLLIKGTVWKGWVLFLAKDLLVDQMMSCGRSKAFSKGQSRGLGMWVGIPGATQWELLRFFGCHPPGEPKGGWRIPPDPSLCFRCQFARCFMQCCYRPYLAEEPYR